MSLTAFDFQGNNVRFVGTIDRPEWVASDICKVLGLDNVSQALSRLEDYQKDDITIDDAIGRKQRVATVLESGLYELIMSSRKPIAKDFKRWVFEEVLPQIRKTGSYSVADKQHPYQRVWYKRLMLFEQNTKIPTGYWSMFTEVAPLMRDLEAHGLNLYDRATIDISVGLCWCKYLRDTGYDTTNFLKYFHHYPDSRGIQLANIYPNELWPEFRNWIDSTYIPDKFPPYVQRICSDEECYLIALAMGYELTPHQMERVKRGMTKR